MRFLCKAFPTAFTLLLPACAACARPPLVAPQHVTVTAAYRQTTLAWSACVGASGYDIYRGTAAGGEEAAPIAAHVAGPPYVDTGLTNGTRYYYKVKAVGGGPGGVSVEVSDTPHPSADAGYYLVTYWAGNSTPLVPDDNGAHPVVKAGPHGGGASTRPVQVIATFTFQPSNANDEPPSALIITTSGPGDGKASRPRFSVRNNPGRSFSVIDGPAGPRSVPASAPPPLPIASALPPYQTNPNLFAGRADALSALQSPDILLRRSGVEWLGRWTQTDGGGGPAGRNATRLAFSRMTELIPALTRGVREMPNQDSRQAARLLALIGPPARSAIPAVCAALASSQYGDGVPSQGIPVNGNDFVARGDLLNSLTLLCGGPDALAPTLTGLLHDPDSETRRAAAAALRFCDDLRFVGLIPTPWHQAFLGLALPAVATSVDDDAGAVRLAAVQSLEHWTFYRDAPWPLALAPLARAASAPDPALRLAALRTLAFMPGDLSPVAPTLRAALHAEEADRWWALAALGHAAETGHARTLDAFLPDLMDPDAARRRVAADDLCLATDCLWNGGFQHGPHPQQWMDDSRLARASAAPDPTAADAQTRLLAALVRAAADPDAAVRRDAASSLELIGEEVDKAESRLQGFDRMLGVKSVRPTEAVRAALAQAATAFRDTDPISAKRLEYLRADIIAPHMSF